MEMILLLNYRGMEQRTTQDGKIYYSYNFENEKGMSVPFSSNEKYAFEKGKDYKLLFSVSKMYFKGVSK